VAVKPEREILIAALNAASQSSRDAASHTSNVRDVGILNEQWAQSYVGIGINDLLRQAYGNNESSFVSFETCVSWLEDFSGALTSWCGPKVGASQA
jgi:hypothetical protein